MYYSSLGAGDGSNSTLNAEYAVIRNADSPTPLLGGPCGMRRVTAIRSAPLRLRAGWQARMVSARKIACHESDSYVMTPSPVVWRRAETRQTPKSAQPRLDNVDKVSVREQRQISMWRVRNPGT